MKEWPSGLFKALDGYSAYFRGSGRLSLPGVRSPIVSSPGARSCHGLGACHSLDGSYPKGSHVATWYVGGCQNYGPFLRL